MGKRVYTSGVAPSDLALETTRKPAGRKTNAADVTAVKAPMVDEAMRAKAAANVRRIYPGGADEVLDALGLLPPRPVKRTAVTFDCPTCGARAGAMCQDSNSSVMKRLHVARNKALKAWLKDNDEGDQP